MHPTGKFGPYDERQRGAPAVIAGEAEALILPQAVAIRLCGRINRIGKTGGPALCNALQASPSATAYRIVKFYCRHQKKLAGCGRPVCHDQSDGLRIEFGGVASLASRCVTLSPRARAAMD
jgi:hypothetical protein